MFLASTESEVLGATYRELGIAGLAIIVVAIITYYFTRAGIKNDDNNSKLSQGILALANNINGQSVLLKASVDKQTEAVLGQTEASREYATVLKAMLTASEALVMQNAANQKEIAAMRESADKQREAAVSRDARLDKLLETVGGNLAVSEKTLQAVTAINTAIEAQKAEIEKQHSAQIGKLDDLKTTLSEMVSALVKPPVTDTAEAVTA